MKFSGIKIGTAGSRQVERACVAMREIVGSVKRVTDITGELFSALAEQVRSIGLVDTAVSQSRRGARHGRLGGAVCRSGIRA